MTVAPVRIADDVRAPMPRLSADTAFFWQSGVDGFLRIQRCAECGRYAHPPTPECRTCGALGSGPVPVSGRATIFSFTVNHQAFVPWLQPPYVLAIVALGEQPDVHLTTRLVDVAPEDVSIGMRVTAVFERHGEVYLPLFAPAEGPAGEAGADA
ncbi:Zn-ribbon domain-containing OB-fold protein [Streptomyces sp. NPDC055400]